MSTQPVSGWQTEKSHRLECVGVDDEDEDEDEDEDGDNGDGERFPRQSAAKELVMPMLRMNVVC